MQPRMRPPGTKRLKLNCELLFITSAFKFNLRRYSVEATCVLGISTLDMGNDFLLFSATW
jgi:hypothetical protein